MASATLQQISVSLDTRIPLEAIVLQRLRRLPNSRQNEWLRQLLLAGFRSECQVIKSAPSLPAHTSSVRLLETVSAKHGYPGAASANQPADAMADSCGRSQRRSHNNERFDRIPQNETTKPFTHLMRVIGE